MQQIDLTVSQAHREIKKIDKQINDAASKLIESKSSAVQALTIQDVKGEHQREKSIGAASITLVK